MRLNHEVSNITQITKSYSVFRNDDNVTSVIIEGYEFVIPHLTFLDSIDKSRGSMP